MKKLVVFCAVILSATILTSCNNDPNAPRCWEVTMTINVFGLPMTTTQYVWCSENELESEKQAIKDQQTQAGVTEEFITITSKKSSKSQSDCH